jgi:hypothetical protein
MIPPKAQIDNVAVPIVPNDYAALYLRDLLNIGLYKWKFWYILVTSPSFCALDRLSGGGSGQIVGHVMRAGVLRRIANLRVGCTLKINLFLIRLFVGASVLCGASSMWAQPTIQTNGALGTRSFGPDEFALVAAGGNGTYVWSLASGSLPPGCTLRQAPDFPSFFSASAHGDLSCVATTPGIYDFSLVVTSGGQTSAAKPFSMKVTELTAMDPGPLPDAFVNVPYPGYTLTALNAASTVTWTATGGLPPGISLSPGGLLSGTPTKSGAYFISLQLNDGTDTIIWQFTINLNVYDVQITSPGLLPSATQYVSYLTQLAASGGVQPYSFAATGLPAGLVLNSATGIISGTPTGGPGSFRFIVTATDSTSPKNLSKTMLTTVVVIGAPVHLPRLTPYGTGIGYSTGIDGCAVGAPCSRGFNMIDGGTPPFSYNVTGLPAGMSFRTGSGTTTTGIYPGDLEIWGTPTTAGSTNVTVTVTDANNASATQTFPLVASNLYVQGVDRLPLGTRGTFYSKTLRVIGGVGPYSVQEISGLFPDGLSLNGLVVSGTPSRITSAAPTSSTTTESSFSTTPAPTACKAPSSLTLETALPPSVSPRATTWAR